jgi:hypothetical protein
VTVKPEKAEPWTKPGGFTLYLEDAAEVLGGMDQGFLALFGDGKSRILDPNLEPTTLKALLTIKGQENAAGTFLDGLDKK